MFSDLDERFTQPQQDCQNTFVSKVMLKNYLKITFRSLLKNKLFVSINILGLGISLACVIVAYLSWDFNEKYDVQHVNADEIYRINFYREINSQIIPNGSCPQPLGDVVRSNIDQVDEVVRYFPTGGNIRIGTELFNTGVAAVDPNFLDVFTFPLVEGNKSMLQEKGQIFISSQLVEKYFPEGDPLGKPLTYINGAQRLEFVVAGVFEKMPLNSSFQFDALVNYDHVYDIVTWEEDDWAQFNTTFVRVKNPESLKSIEDELQNYVEIQNRAKEDYKVKEFYLDPFVGMAIRAERENVWNHWFRQSMPTPAVIAPIVMAALILLIACFNFTNTSIAIANRRLKEIGIRKVLGSQRRQLIAQFLGENIILTFFALIAGLLFAEVLVPAYNKMWPFLNIELGYLRNIQFFGFLFVLLILTGIIAGSYPAFYVTGFRPASILRGTLKYGGTSRFTQVLLSFQFAVSLIAVISGILFAQNAEYQKNYDVGFEGDEILFAYVVDEEGHNAFRNELQGYSKIKEISGSRHNIASNWYMDPVKFGAQEVDVDILDIGDNYLKTIGSEIIAGRDFIENSQSDVENSAIVNEAMVRTFGWEEPVGQRIILRDTVELFVVGVVKDQYLRGLWDEVRPSLLRYTLPPTYQYVIVQADVTDIQEVKEYMEEAWKEVFPDRLTNVRYLNEQLGEAEEVNSNIKEMFVFLGLIAIVLSAIGLFSLVTLNIIKKMKEIGVRKVLGASVLDIIQIINKPFIIILLFAAILGSIGGYFLTDMLMGSIWVYYMDIGPFAFIVAILCLIIVATITVGGKVAKAAMANPSTTLRDE